MPGILQKSETADQPITLSKAASIHNQDWPEEAGHKAADQHPAKPGVKELGQQGGLSQGWPPLPHAHSAAPQNGAQLRLPYSLAFSARFEAPSVSHLFMTIHITTGFTVPLFQVIWKFSHVFGRL